MTSFDAASRRSLLAEAARLTRAQWDRLDAATKAAIAAALADEERAVARANEPLLDFVPRVSPGHFAPVHLRVLAALLERAERERLNICVSVPPGHGKTDLLLHAMVRRLARWPGQLVGYVTYGLDLSLAKSREAREIAARAGVELAADSSAVQEWNTAAGGGFKATGIGAGLTGRHLDLLVFDDPFKNREDAESARQREVVYNFFTSTATTRCKANASRVVVHTRWHTDDLIGRLEQSTKVRWHVVNLPAIRDDATGEPSDDGEVLLPERRLPSGSIFGYSRELLAERRAENEYDWWSLYQGRPRPRGGKVFALEDPPRFDARFHEAARRVVLSLDAAGTENTRSDYTVVGALEFEGAGAAMVCNVVDVERYQLEPQHAAPKVLAFQRRHGDGLSLRIEATRDGKALAKALRALAPGIRIVEVPPIGDKFVRAQPVASAWNAGRVRVPRHAPWVEDFLDEVRRFTGLGDRHDDQVDMLSQGWNAAGGGPRVQVRPDPTAVADLVATAPPRVQLAPDAGRWAGMGKRGF